MPHRYETRVLSFGASQDLSTNPLGTAEFFRLGAEVETPAQPPTEICSPS